MPAYGADTGARSHLGRFDDHGYQYDPAGARHCVHGCRRGQARGRRRRGEAGMLPPRPHAGRERRRRRRRTGAGQLRRPRSVQQTTSWRPRWRRWATTWVRHGGPTGPGLAADLAQEVADRARSLSRHLDQREPGELLDDVRRFARQRPGTFLLGALAAGVIAGRLLRGTRDAVEEAEARDTSRVSPDSRTATEGPPSRRRSARRRPSRRRPSRRRPSRPGSARGRRRPATPRRRPTPSCAAPTRREG